MPTYPKGTVALAIVSNHRGGVEETRVSRYDSGWARLDDPNDFFNDDLPDGHLEILRPLVVLDIEGLYYPGAPEHVIEQLGSNWSWLGDEIRKQTREPRIDEPGLFAVVRDGGRELFRYSLEAKRSWIDTSNRNRVGWTEIDDPVLVREGV